MEIAQWLQQLGLEQYEPAFRANAIDDSVLRQLTADDLKELGVTMLGHRRKLLDAITQLASAPAQPAATPVEAERRQLSILFCDLVGSTDLATRLDPEDLREVIGAYHACVSATAARFQGFVAQYLGDGVLLYFGYPQAREDDAEQAVRCALASILAVRSLKPKAAAQLHLRIGIATGLVVVGDLVAAGATQEHKIVGETPNLAARLQALAAPDTVVIADNTKRLVGGLFDYDDLGAVELKGFATPVRAWRVRAESAVESRYDALHAGAGTLVGREEEFELMLRRWAQVKTGAGRVALLSGEPGIGKSGLIRALGEKLAGEDHARVNFYCSPNHQDSALHPVIAQLERVAGFERDDDGRARRDKLAAWLSRTQEDIGERLALFAELLSLPSVDGAPLELTPQQRKARTLAASVELLAEQAAMRPLLAVFEDVHWIDPTSRELLEMLVERVQGLPVFLVITFRPEFVPPWTGRHHVTLLALNRLGQLAGEGLVEATAGGRMLPREVMAEIIARTDGIPLFIEELTKTVIEGGMLRQEGERYVLAGPLPALAIPTSLQSSLLARLDRLGTVREVAQSAAAIGREFAYDLLDAVARLSGERLQHALAQLVEAGLIFARGTPPDALYTFKHALIQDAAYASLLRGRRQELHARIAAALGERAGVEPELLAQHLTAAADMEHAVPQWLAAGRRAAQRSANPEAIAHFRKALAAVQELPESEARARRELEIQMALGPTLLGIWQMSEAGRAFERTLELCAQVGDERSRFNAFWGLWLSSQAVHVDVPRQRSLVREMFGLAQRFDDDGLRLQANHAGWATELMHGTLVRARQHVQDGLALYDMEKHRHHALQFSGHDPGVCAYCLGSLGMLLLGYPSAAAKSQRDGLALAERLGHAPSFANGLFTGSTSLVYVAADPPAALDAADRLIAVATPLQLVAQIPVGTLLRGWALVHLGQKDEGLAEARRGLDEYARGPLRLFETFYRALHAEACLACGEHDEGLAAASEARTLAENSGERVWHAEILRIEGELLLLGHDRAAAERSFQQAVTVARQDEAKTLELRASTSLARLWQAQGKAAEAHALLAPVHGWFTEGFDSHDLVAAATLLKELR
jgi:class 3 adenylate cyclase/predicted ATPase